MKLHILVAVFIVVIAVLSANVAITPSASPVDFDQATVASTEAATAAATEAAACPDVIKAALDTTAKACAAAGRNQACYGNIALKADPQPDATGFAFDTPGQTVALSSLHDLQLSALDSINNTWGIALLRIQANLPDTAPGQNVTMLLFGDVQTQNAVQNPTTTIDVTAVSNTNVRQTPSNAGQFLAKLAAKSTATATGRLKDGSWLRVEAASADGKSKIKGWLPADSVEGSSDINSLDVIDPSTPIYGPMQAFYFRSGTGVAACKDAPRDGILIQGPKQRLRVTLSIDDAEVTHGSTIYVQAQPSGKMLLSTLEGLAIVRAKGRQVNVPAGMQVEVPLDANLKASGPPALPHSYKLTDFTGLPLSLLPTNITITRPFVAQAASTGKTSSAPASSNSGSSTVCPSGVFQAETGPKGRVSYGCTCANGFHIVQITQGPFAPGTAEQCN